MRFFISEGGGVLYCPDQWYDRQGYPRYASSAFILASRVRNYIGAEHGWAVPLNPPNLEDIFVKLPDLTQDDPLWKGIVARLIELELRGRVMRGAESLKLDVGVAKSIKEVPRYFFYKSDGTGYGPSFTREEEVEEAQLLEWDTYSPPGRKFYYQQRVALSMMERVPKCLLAMEQRVGKTPTMITAAKSKHDQGLIKLTLVVSTRRLLYTAWTEDLTMYWPDASFTILGNDKSRADFTEKSYEVAMTSFESLYRNWPLIRRLYDPSEVMIIADETIKIKSPDARRTTAMLAACSEVRYCYLLSGAPVSRLHSDLFPQLMCVDPGLFGLNYTASMDFFFQFYQDGSMRFRKGRKALFHTIADLGVWRCTRGEAEQFKGKETSTVNERIKFDPLQATLYHDLADYMYATLMDDDVSASVKATNILVQLGRLREICSGFISYEFAPGMYERIRLPNNPKMDWLREYFTDNDGSRAILFCEYNETEAMCGELLDEMGISWGGMLKVKQERKAGKRYGSPDHQFKQHMDEFQEGSRQVFLGKHSSIGHGLTLNAAEVEIFVEMGFNSDNYDQARMRAVGGDTGHVLVYHLLMGGSLEETKIYKALSARQNMKAAVLKDLDRQGYASFFREISVEELLVNDTYRVDSIDDMLETKARRELGYSGELVLDELTEWATLQGHGLFARIKRSIGSMGSLKSAFKSIAFNFHPDRAEAQGHEPGSPMYMLHEKIFKEAVAARKESVSLGEFVRSLGGKELSPGWQMWYDYLVRKCHGRTSEIRVKVAGLIEEKKAS
jgi:hypothetical protein